MEYHNQNVAKMPLFLYELFRVREAIEHLKMHNFSLILLCNSCHFLTQNSFIWFGSISIKTSHESPTTTEHMLNSEHGAPSMCPQSVMDTCTVMGLLFSSLTGWSATIMVYSFGMNDDMYCYGPTSLTACEEPLLWWIRLDQQRLSCS